MKIEAGEYVRTKKGIIYQADQNYYLNNNIPVKFATFSDRVVKHSKIIFDLLEAGDVLNLYVVEDEEYIKVELLKDYYNDWIEDLKSGKLKLISIVTKEQFAQAEYKIEEDK